MGNIYQVGFVERLRVQLECLYPVLKRNYQTGLKDAFKDVLAGLLPTNDVRFPINERPGWLILCSQPWSFVVYRGNC